MDQLQDSGSEFEDVLAKQSDEELSDLGSTKLGSQASFEALVEEEGGWMAPVLASASFKNLLVCLHTLATVKNCLDDCCCSGDTETHATLLPVQEDIHAHAQALRSGKPCSTASQLEGQLKAFVASTGRERLNLCVPRSQGCSAVKHS